MGLEISEFRNRIGLFNLVTRKQRRRGFKSKSKQPTDSNFNLILVTVLLLFFLSTPAFTYSPFSLKKANISFNLARNTGCVFNPVPRLMKQMSNSQVENYVLEGFEMANINKVNKLVNGNKKTSGYNLAYWNCNRGLLKSGDNNSEKFTEIKLFIEEKQPHLFCIAETDIHGNRSNKNRVVNFKTQEIHEKLKVEGYSVVLPETWEAYGQARILVFVSDKILAKKVDISPADSDLPTISFEIGFSRERKTLVNFYYRDWASGVTGEKSDSSQLDRFQRQVEIWRKLNVRNRDLVILGDANFCYKSCNSQEYPSNLKKYLKYCH